jgi:siroheme synthase-like protein
MANDIKNYNMIIAATSSKVVNHLIKVQLSENILFVDTSDASNSNFVIPAVVERGAVKLAISTSGQVPFLSKEICAYLDKILPVFPQTKLSNIAKKRTSIIERSGENRELKKQLMENELNPLIIELFKKDEL